METATDLAVAAIRLRPQLSLRARWALEHSAWQHELGWWCGGWGVDVGGYTQRGRQGLGQHQGSHNRYFLERHREKQRRREHWVPQIRRQQLWDDIFWNFLKLQVDLITLLVDNDKLNICGKTTGKFVHLKLKFSLELKELNGLNLDPVFWGPITSTFKGIHLEVVEGDL